MNGKPQLVLLLLHATAPLRVLAPPPTTCSPRPARTALTSTRTPTPAHPPPTQVLRHVRGAPNVISLLDVFPPMSGLQPPHNFQDIYLVYDLMDTDLHQIVRSPQALSGACPRLASRWRGSGGGGGWVCNGRGAAAFGHAAAVLAAPARGALTARRSRPARSRVPLADDHVQYFLYQLLRGLKYLHTAGVVHR